MPTCQACGHPNPDDAAVCDLCGTPLTSRPGVGDTRLGEEGKTVFEAGDLIADRYFVERVLGRGGMGVVYRARDTMLGERTVALKLIRPELVAHPEARQRFMQEVTIGLDLSHPSIVRVHDLKERGGLLFFTMEYVEGRSLREWMVERKGQVPPFTLAETAAVISPLLDALEYAHNKTIHRDIKPENIMVTGAFPQVGVKVLDFGIAKTLSASSFTRTAHAMGTAYYMSPEQLAGSAEIDLRSDLYSVGMVLYEMLTGDMAVGRFELPRQIVENLPVEIDDLVEKSLATRPEKRFQTDAAMRASLTAAVAAGLAAEAEREKAEEERRKAEEEARRREERAAEEARRRADRMDALLDEAREAEEGHRWQEAADAFGQVLEIGAKHVDASKGLAEARKKAARLAELEQAAAAHEKDAAFDAAIAVLEETLPLTPRPSEVKARLADLRRRREQAADAELEDLLDKGRKALSGRRWREAAGLFAKVLERSPEHAEAARLRQEAEDKAGKLELLTKSVRDLEQAGRLSEAIEQQRLLLPLAPSLADAQRKLAVLEEDAKAAGEQSERRRRIEVLLRKARDAEGQRDWASAEGYYRQALQVDGSHAAARQGAESAAQKRAQCGRLESEAREAEKAGHLDVARERLKRLEPLAADPAAISEWRRRLEAKTEKPEPEPGPDKPPAPDPAPAAKRGLRPAVVTLLAVALLAAVGVPGYLSYRKGVYDAQAKADLETGYTAAQAHFADFPGTESCVDLDKLGLGGLRLSRGVRLEVKRCYPDDLVLVAWHPQGSEYYLMDAAGRMSKAGKYEELERLLAVLPRHAKAAVAERRAQVAGARGDAASRADASSDALVRNEKVWTDPTTGMEFVWVPGGCFRMGSNDGYSHERPVHEVCVDGFWMGKYEVTQAEWQKVMGSNPSVFKGARNPVESVSWEEAQTFIRKLNASGSGPGKYRLPTEAEWEYAARSGGKDEEYAGGSDLDRLGWYAKNSGSRTHAVGEKAPNGLGLYDMSGNVWEWCADWKGAYPSGKVANPTGPAGGSWRVFRGGGWYDSGRNCRAAYRHAYPPGDRFGNLGFRLVRTIP